MMSIGLGLYILSTLKRKNRRKEEKKAESQYHSITVSGTIG